MDNHGDHEPQELLDAFWTHYHCFEHLVMEATNHPTNSTVLTRFGDELDEYINLINMVKKIRPILIDKILTSQQHSTLFPVEELHTIWTNLGVMQTDVCIQYQETLDSSHHRRPTIIQEVHTSGCGCPHIFSAGHIPIKLFHGSCISLGYIETWCEALYLSTEL